MFILYAAYFFVYSFIGWAWEVIDVLVTTGKLVNRGFFLGPICPIYGVSILFIVLLLERFENHIVLIFFAGAFIITAVEFITGFLLEKIFHTRWWDYSQFRFNFHGYVSLEISIIWGAFSVLALKVLHPFITRQIAGLSPGILQPMVLVVVILFLTDMGLTVFRMFRLRGLLDKAAITARDIKAALEQQISLGAGEGLSKLQLLHAGLSEQYENQIDSIRAEFRRWFMSNPSVHSVKYGEQIQKLKAQMHRLQTGTSKKKKGKKIS